MKILHVIQQLSCGGAARAMLSLIKYCSLDSRFKHQILSLLPPNLSGFQNEQLTGLQDKIIEGNETEIKQIIEEADIVQVHFWNSPEMYEFLASSLPPHRLIIWLHIAGNTPPHILPKMLINNSDKVIASSPYTLEIQSLASLKESVKLEKIKSIYSISDFARLENFASQEHQEFVVGYLGTTNPVKIHPNYIQMNGDINIPNIRFLVAGDETGCLQLQKQAEKLNVSDKFEFLGYIKNIKSFLEKIDVFGYPLCPNNYSTVELVLQEVMWVGIPPVIFAYGGAQRTVIHQETGLIVHSEKEYQEAILYLYENPQERKRLGDNAKIYAQKNFAHDLIMGQWKQLYQETIELPKTLHQLSFNSDVGSDIFRQTLDKYADPFCKSLSSDNIQELLESDSIIASSSPVLYNISGGGILHYQRYYSKDAYLSFWGGLVWQKQGQNIRAIAYFKKAIQLGFPHWRIHWYLAKAFEKVKAFDLMKTSLQEVINADPSFGEAKNMLDYYS
ncbi:glycosyltransferase family 4 protein [Crocosphaera sp.]|uniref:glycosyltransferase family 4 protein n=1 Tax=Crocosphaera sp. TaxID=2729996 RepID=UPI00261A18AB|nr:glycosyltransferase family 4 protein [Crocosphaera sp.]MDJ0581298.1 glycosyltransferase family 4 protein [Crocosphaera sp.]